MRNFLSSLLLAWLASINAGMSSLAQIADLPTINDNQDSEMTGSKVRSYDSSKDEMVIPRLRHRLRKDISTRLGTRGLLFDKMERSRSRRRRSRRPSFYSEPPLRYGGRYSSGLGSFYNPYGRYEMDQYDEFPDELEAFFMYPFSRLFDQSSEFDDRSPPLYYRPQSYNRPPVPAPTQPSYYPGQYWRPQQVESPQARPYYSDQNLGSKRRPSRERPNLQQSSPYQAPQVRPYYSGQALQPSSQPSSLYYNDRPTAVNTSTRPMSTTTGQENLRQPPEPTFQRQQIRPGYPDESNVQLLRPNTQGQIDVPISAARVNSSQPMQSAFQQQSQVRPNYLNESNIQSPALNAQGEPLRTSGSRVNNTLQRQPANRDELDVRLQPLNNQRPSAPTSNHEQATDSPRFHQLETVPDGRVDSRDQNTQLQSSPISNGAREDSQQLKLDQNAMSGVPQKTPVQSDQREEVQPQPDATAENQNHDQRGQPRSSLAAERKNGQPPATSGFALQKIFEKLQPMNAI